MENLPIALYGCNQIKQMERDACQHYGITGFELMLKAGYQVFACLQKQYPDAKSVAVFCGGGNNGGDGYSVASLALAAGLVVELYALSDPSGLKNEALSAYQNYLHAGGKVLHFQPSMVLAVDVVIDALLGTGLARTVAGAYADAITAINDSGINVIAVDVPSGLNADTGRVMGCAVKARYTVTFIGLKQGLFTGQAAEYSGVIRYAPLAIPEALLQAQCPQATRLLRQTISPRKRYAHKGELGHVWVVGGDLGYLGAARLAGEAALRCGAGLVSVATRPEHAIALNFNRPELMCHGVETGRQLQKLLAKADVVVVGPGLGQGDWGRALFLEVLAAEKPTVIDADALNILAALPDGERIAALAHSILTPHVGEAARLLNCPNAAVSEDRFAAVTALQRKYQGVAVLKGSGTLIADGHGVAVSSTGNPGMASGGMGDVLAGVIGSLLAQGLSLTAAAQQGVYIHGLAADLCAQEHGERGLLAADLMPYLRGLVN